MNKKNAGFTLIEVLITIAIIGIAAAFAVPTFLDLLPNWRAKAAATDLFSNLQLAKVTAIRKGMHCGIQLTGALVPAGGTFDGAVPCQYQVALFESDLTTVRQVIRTVALDDYGSKIWFRGPIAGAIYPRFDDSDVGQATKRLIFNSRGMVASNAFSINLSSVKFADVDPERTYYRAGVTTAGVVRMQRYEGGVWN